MQKDIDALTLGALRLYTNGGRQRIGGDLAEAALRVREYRDELALRKLVRWAVDHRSITATGTMIRAAYRIQRRIDQFDDGTLIELLEPPIARAEPAPVELFDVTEYQQSRH